MELNLFNRICKTDIFWSEMTLKIKLHKRPTTEVKNATPAPEINICTASEGSPCNLFNAGIRDIDSPKKVPNTPNPTRIPGMDSRSFKLMFFCFKKSSKVKNCSGLILF